MLLLIIMLAVSLNIDSLGVGISYGIRKIKVPMISKIILCSLSIIYTSIAIMFGKWLVAVLPGEITNIIGVTILITMGVLIIVKNVFSKESIKENNVTVSKIKKTNPINFYIKPLQLTIQIIKDPIYGDIDNSNVISSREALYLGIALSIDSLGAGIGSCAAGMSSLFIPFAIGIFQITFLTLGISIGKKIASYPNINKKLSFVISGLLLITLGIIRLFS